MSKQVRTTKLKGQDQSDPLRTVGEFSWLSLGVTERSVLASWRLSEWWVRAQALKPDKPDDVKVLALPLMSYVIQGINISEH